jgi:hypothetical protein
MHETALSPIVKRFLEAAGLAVRGAVCGREIRVGRARSHVSDLLGNVLAAVCRSGSEGLSIELSSGA